MSECKCVREMAWFRTAPLDDIRDYQPVQSLVEEPQRPTRYANRNCPDCGGTGEVAPIATVRRGLAGIDDPAGGYTTRSFTERTHGPDGNVTGVRSTTIGVSRGDRFDERDRGSKCGDSFHCPSPPACDYTCTRPAGHEGQHAQAEEGCVPVAQWGSLDNRALAAADGGSIEKYKMLVWKGPAPSAEQVAQWTAAPVYIVPIGTEVQVIRPGESAERHGMTVHNKTTGGYNVTLAGPEPDPVDAFRALLEACYMPAMIEHAREAWRAVNPHGRISWDHEERGRVRVTFALGGVREVRLLMPDDSPDDVENVITAVMRNMGPALVAGWKAEVRRG